MENSTQSALPVSAPKAIEPGPASGVTIGSGIAGQLMMLQSAIVGEAPESRGEPAGAVPLVGATAAPPLVLFQAALTSIMAEWSPLERTIEASLNALAASLTESCPAFFRLIDGRLKCVCSPRMQPGCRHRQFNCRPPCPPVPPLSARAPQMPAEGGQARRGCSMVMCRTTLTSCGLATP